MVYLQQPPFSVRVELAEGCNLRCHFCGIQGIREKAGGHYHFMSEETITSIFTQIRDLRWNPRVEFTMHGEPTMHPRYKEMIQIAYEICPKVQLMLTTNGAGIVRDPGPKANIGQLFRSSGLNILALDDYEGVKLILRAGLIATFPISQVLRHPRVTLWLGGDAIGRSGRSRSGGTGTLLYVAMTGAGNIDAVTSTKGC
jgi:hypothetical protein